LLSSCWWVPVLLCCHGKCAAICGGLVRQIRLLVALPQWSVAILLGEQPMLNKYTVTLSVLALIGGIVPAMAAPAPIPIIGVGFVASAAVAGAMVVARVFMKR
jgi:hypothetical protein